MTARATERGSLPAVIVTGACGLLAFGALACGGGNDGPCPTCPSDACVSCPPDACVSCMASCGDDTCGTGETCRTCADDCGACPTGTCGDGELSAGEDGVDCGGPCLACEFPQGRSEKRGAAYNFCDWSFSEGQDDLDLLTTGTTAGSGLTWFYNWGVTPGACIASSPDLDTTIEFVPMAWGLTNDGAACASGGACFTDSRSRDQLLALVPAAARYLLGFNEPNFMHQAGLTPTVAAQAWTHLEYVADARGLGLVGPAVNFCDTTPGTTHGGACNEEPGPRTFTFAGYSETFAAAYRYNAFEWLELFYDECSADGTAGHDCRIDYQAGHVYSYWSLDWMIAIFKRKAGLLPPTDAHCTNDVEDDDEFGVDCGGQECAACTAWARAQFAKALWMTELAPSTDDAGGPQTTQQRIDRANAYIDSQIPIMEGDPYVFRYAWFMPKTDIGSLDHVDLLTETTPVQRTTVGENYLNEAH